ncbi:MAG: GMP/IMP nucleotidase [Thiobacillaceae bacterium]
MLDWKCIQTVLLDMDGTLLDLHYDNHFWREHVPLRYAQKQGISHEAARQELAGRYHHRVGTLEWYCVDFWSRELDMDIAALKEEVAHLIAIHPDVPEFLSVARATGKRVVMVTNAHRKSVILKMRTTGLEAYFDALHSAHDVGQPKEAPTFWQALQEREPFDPSATLLVDDSLPVLRSAREFGIAHLLAVRFPDTRLPEKDPEEFQAIHTFRDILPV